MNFFFGSTSFSLFFLGRTLSAIPLSITPGSAPDLHPSRCWYTADLPSQVRGSRVALRFPCQANLLGRFQVSQPCHSPLYVGLVDLLSPFGSSGFIPIKVCSHQAFCVFCHVSVMYQIMYGGRRGYQLGTWSRGMVRYEASAEDRSIAFFSSGIRIHTHSCGCSNHDHQPNKPHQHFRRTSQFPKPDHFPEESSSLNRPLIYFRLRSLLGDDI